MKGHWEDLGLTEIRDGAAIMAETVRGESSAMAVVEGVAKLGSTDTINTTTLSEIAEASRGVESKIWVAVRGSARMRKKQI